MLSLLSHNSGIHVYVVCPDIQQNNRLLLEETARSYGGCCTILHVPYSFAMKKTLRQRWPFFTITRLFAAKILPDTIHRILYLDSDTFVIGNLEKLWDMNMKGFCYCGVKDCVGRRYKRNIGLSDNDPYINGGVFLADLNALRKLEIKSGIEEFFRKYIYSMSYFDQDVLNSVFRGNIGILPPEYNVMTTVIKMDYKSLCILRHPSNYYSREEINSARGHPYIIHFSSHLLSIRPWFRESEHPYAELFQHIADISPWTKQVPRKAAPFLQRFAALIFQTCPASIRKVILYIFGFIHSVLYPDFRYLKNEAYQFINGG